MLRVRVDGDRASELGRDQFGHHRDARRTPDEQHAREVARVNVRARHRSLQGGHGLDERDPNHRLELAAGEAHLSAQTGQHDRDRGLGVDRQRFLRVDAVVPESGEERRGRGIVEVELSDRVGTCRADVGEHRFVEVDAAETLDPLRLAEHREALVVLSEDRGVERPSAQVVHRDDRAGLEPRQRRVVHGSGLGFADPRRRSERPRCGRSGRAARACTGPNSRDGTRPLCRAPLPPSRRRLQWSLGEGGPSGAPERAARRRAAWVRGRRRAA